MAPLGPAEQRFPGSNHVCLIFNSEDQRRRVLSEYLAAGLEQGELVRYFTDATSPESIRAWLVDRGIELPGAEERGAFVISSATRVYCPEGRFEPQTLIAGAIQRCALAERAGYPGIRTTGEMSWVLKGYPGSERFLEYEALLNTLATAFPIQEYANMMPSSLMAPRCSMSCRSIPSWSPRGRW